MSEIQGGEERFLEEVFIRNNFASDLTRIFGIMEFLTESFERFDGILSLQLQSVASRVSCESNGVDVREEFNKYKIKKEQFKSETINYFLR